MTSLQYYFLQHAIQKFNLNLSFVLLFCPHKQFMQMETTFFISKTAQVQELIQQ